jgi:chemotaxis protein CheX
MSPGVFLLPSILDLRAAAPLKADIETRSGAPLDLDASQVERLGGLCLQVILAAADSWRSSGAELRVTGASDAFSTDARLMGARGLLPLHDLEGTHPW